ncbi:GGDEF domain-containing protein [Maridesulfovibrio ferrireducens]|uniref:GGDEF domain-containing protein n=1 Tax=Maridesulfovibrio ferrireducens TaxID=246191 RepID=UPI001A2DCD63|nr:GGDEF domain-containing protein [Maridesulfovibrio ferrireducens]MBI9110672.1 diguanylate cyclase [Maridesulfovibrio ferrireducens]
MDITIRALLFDNSLISFALGFIMLLFSFFHKRYRGFILISLAYLCLSISFLLSASRSFLPEYSIIASKTLGLASLILMKIGIERFRQIPHKLIKLSLLLLCAIFASSYFFTFITPDTLALEISFSVLISLQLALCIWATLRKTKKLKNYQYMLVFAGMLLVLALSAKIFAMMKYQDFQTTLTYWIHMLTYSFALIASSFAFIWGSVERAEIEKDNQTAKLEQNYHFMDAFLDAIPLPVFYKDKKLRYRNINQAFSEIMGIPKDQILGKTTTEVVPKKIAELIKNHDIAMLETGQKQEYETAFPFSDGLHHEIEVKKSPFIDSSGKIAGIAGAFIDITERKIYEAKIKHLALHDQVTGLPNRNMFYAQLKKSIAMAKRNKYTLALLYIDLDGFKSVNDDFGHDAGDTLLRTIGKRLSTAVRESDTACRIGGDEFTVLIEMYNDPSDVIIVAEKIRTGLAEPATCESHPCRTSASIGIALYPQDAESSRDLVKAADKAMYSAKQQGKNKICFYNNKI